MIADQSLFLNRQQIAYYYGISINTFITSVTMECSTHNMLNNIFDLNLKVFICQKCALFSPQHRCHEFIDSQILPAYVSKTYLPLLRRFQTLKLQQKYEGIQWQPMSDLAARQTIIAIQAINKKYDEIVLKIEKQRSQQLRLLNLNIQTHLNDTVSSLGRLIAVQYRSIQNKLSQINRYFEQEEFACLLQKLQGYNIESKLQTIQKELQFALFQLQNKFQCDQPQLSVPLLNKKSSYGEELLINGLDVTFQPLSMKTQRMSLKSNCKTQVSITNSSKDTKIIIQTVNTDKSYLKITQKNTLSSVHVKNEIKTVDISQLNLTNRQALQAVLQCTRGNFVSRIDLSRNRVGSALIAQLKRQKLSKYLKSIVLKGANIDVKQLKKEGLQVTNSNTIQIGKITIQL